MVRNIKDKLQKDLEAIQRELKVTLPQEIKRAREHGDLSENAEYQAAKERQRYLQAKAAQLTTRLSALAMVNFDRIPTDAVSYGSTVHLYETATDRDVVYTLVSSEESDVKAGLISTSSPIGRSLMGKTEGDEVTINTPGGSKTYEIRKLITIHDAAADDSESGSTPAASDSDE
jgi:transcription elongation factor GreA